MLTLLLDGSPVPSTFTVGRSYALTVASTGGPTVVSISWTLARRAESLSEGVGSFVFEPTAASVYYFDVIAVMSDGTEEEAIFMLPAVIAGARRSNAYIRWSNRLPKLYDKLAAFVEVNSPVTPKSIAWTCFLNNVPVVSGTGPQIAFGALQPGVYRVQATVIDSTDGETLADSSITIPGQPALIASVVPPQPSPTLQFLGDIYSPWLITSELYCTYLPYELTSISSDSYLLPGTEYIQPEVEGVVDDEVVIRTQTGNWTAKGPPSGLTNETIAYDYQHHQPYIPAPLDLKLRYTVDSWNAHGLVAGAQRFRVKFKCYRQAPALYRYTACDWAAYPGGEGERQRRLVAVVTQADVECDADLHLNRSGSGITTYALPGLTELQPTRLETTGSSDKVFQDDRFFTSQTVACHYEAAEGGPTLKINAIYGLAGVRPCYLDFGQAAHPRIVQKVKRVYGKLLVFVAGGGFAANTSITVKAHTSAGESQHVIPVTENVYAPDYDRYLKVGEADIDLSNFEFDRLGLVFDFTVDETGATTGVPSYYPLPKPAEDVLYSSINAPAVKYDGACFSNPTSVAAFSGTWATEGVTIVGCNQIECGPLGLYCYTALASAGTLIVAQPLGFPAPVIAPQWDQTKCYGSPAYLQEVLDNSALLPMFAYTSATTCGIGYVYTACETGSSLAVIYPTASVPHSFVFYGSNCYAYSGSVADLRPYTAVPVSSVTAVVDCQDYLCTAANASGPSVVYRDVATQQKVNVNFPHLDLGVPLFGAVPAAGDPGYGDSPPGTVRCGVTRARSVFDLFTARETATIKVQTEQARYLRWLVVKSGLSSVTYLMQAGLTEKTINVQAGDQVKLNFVGLCRTGYVGEVKVRYEKEVLLPRLYHTAVVEQADKSALRALGFCGVTDRDSYVFFDGLPGGAEQSPCNPDSRLTVQGTLTSEMVLIDNRAIGETAIYSNLAYYAGQQIQGPLTFRFYADRDRAGQHGEMDVWLETDQPFPAYLKVSPYQVVSYGTYSYRRDTQEGDVSRRGLRAAASPAGVHYPLVHISAAGERISVMSNGGTVYQGGQAYVFTGTLDTGLSENVAWNLPY